LRQSAISCHLPALDPTPGLRPESRRSRQSLTRAAVTETRNERLGEQRRRRARIRRRASASHGDELAQRPSATPGFAVSRRSERCVQPTLRAPEAGAVSRRPARPKTTSDPASNTNDRTGGRSANGDGQANQEAEKSRLNPAARAIPRRRPKRGCPAVQGDRHREIAVADQKAHGATDCRGQAELQPALAVRAGHICRRASAARRNRRRASDATSAPGGKNRPTHEGEDERNDGRQIHERGISRPSEGNCQRQPDSDARARTAAPFSTM